MKIAFCFLSADIKRWVSVAACKVSILIVTFQIIITSLNLDSKIVREFVNCILMKDFETSNLRNNFKHQSSKARIRVGLFLFPANLVRNYAKLMGFNLSHTYIVTNFFCNLFYKFQEQIRVALSIFNAC